jgi:nucleoside-diphosphate-sugar epimerase
LAEILDKAMIDEVYHLAAEPYIPECYEFPEKFFKVNANGTLNVLLACKEVGIKKILYFSTSEVYGTGSGVMDENFRLNPQSTYAVSKLAGDRLAFTLFKEQGVPTIILRQFNCYGPRETHEYIIPEIITQLTFGNKLKLGNIKAKRDFTYVEDAANMAVELMENGIPGEVYNIGSGRAYSIETIAQTIGRIQNGKLPIIEIDKNKLRPHDVEYLRADERKAYLIIKYRPKTDLITGLSQTIQWYYDNGNKWGFENV